MDWYDPTCYASEIMDAKYGKVSTDDVVDKLTHLTSNQKDDLKSLFHGFTKLFDGTLGVYPHQKYPHQPNSWCKTQAQLTLCHSKNSSGCLQKGT